MGEANLVLGYADRFLVRKLPLLLVCLSAKGNQAGSRTRAGKCTSAEEGWRIREGFVFCVVMFVSVCRPHLRFPETSRTSIAVAHITSITLLLTSFGYVIVWLFRQGV